jgi:hypothetical protein
VDALDEPTRARGHFFVAVIGARLSEELLLVLPEAIRVVHREMREQCLFEVGHAGQPRATAIELLEPVEAPQPVRERLNEPPVDGWPDPLRELDGDCPGVIIWNQAGEISLAGPTAFG